MATKTRVRGPLERHDARIKTTKRRRTVQVTDATRREFLERISNGEFPTCVCADERMPSWQMFMRLARQDAGFATELEHAVANLANARLSDAGAYLVDAAQAAATSDEPGAIEEVRVAEIYIKSIANVLEKIAPKSHGQLLKVAGSDGGALAVQVVQYSNASKNTDG